MSSGLTVWKGHRGDGDVALALAGASSPIDQGTAMQASHDQVISQTGRLRAGPVQWVVHPGRKGMDLLREQGIDVPPELRTYLEQHATSVLVVAMVPTDRKRPGRKNARPSRKASR